MWTSPGVFTLLAVIQIDQFEINRKIVCRESNNLQFRNKIQSCPLEKCLPILNSYLYILTCTNCVLDLTQRKQVTIYHRQNEQRGIFTS